jgi:hypothetical protein
MPYNGSRTVAARLAHVLVPDGSGADSRLLSTHDDIGVTATSGADAIRSPARASAPCRVLEPARKVTKALSSSRWPEAKYEVVIPGLVNVSEDLVVYLAGEIETPDVGTEGCVGGNHLNAAPIVLIHMSLSTSFARSRVREAAQAFKHYCITVVSQWMRRSLDG